MVDIAIIISIISIIIVVIAVMRDGSGSGLGRVRSGVPLSLGAIGGCTIPWASKRLYAGTGTQQEEFQGIELDVSIYMS